MVTLKNCEDTEQILFVQWFRRQYPKILIFHIPNGGKRGIREAAMFKAMGVVAGVPDLFIPSLTIWIEMKRKDGGTVSAAQKEIHAYLRGIGHEVIIGKGWEHARDQLQRLRELSLRHCD